MKTTVAIVAAFSFMFTVTPAQAKSDWTRIGYASATSSSVHSYPAIQIETSTVSNFTAVRVKIYGSRAKILHTIFATCWKDNLPTSEINLRKVGYRTYLLPTKFNSYDSCTISVSAYRLMGSKGTISVSIDQK